MRDTVNVCLLLAAVTSGIVLCLLPTFEVLLLHLVFGGRSLRLLSPQAADLTASPCHVARGSSVFSEAGK